MADLEFVRGFVVEGVWGEGSGVGDGFGGGRYHECDEG